MWGSLASSPSSIIQRQSAPAERLRFLTRPNRKRPALFVEQAFSEEYCWQRRRCSGVGDMSNSSIVLIMES